MSNHTTALRSSKMDVRKLVTLAMLAALGIVLVALIEVPLLPGAPFLKYDPADIPILIGTLIYGPGAGIILTIIISFIQSFMLHGSGGIIGFIMHVIATGAMAFVAGMLYKYSKKRLLSAVFSLTMGALAMVVCMAGMNLILTPIFMHTPVEVVKQMMIPLILPFNILKAGINCTATFLVYRYVEKIALR